jgi:hypothetical protein
MLTAAGFRIEQVRLIRHSDWLRSSAKLATAQKTARGYLRLLTSKSLAKLTASLVHLGNASDCLMAVAERPM